MKGEISFSVLNMFFYAKFGIFIYLFLKLIRLLAQTRAADLQPQLLCYQVLHSVQHTGVRIRRRVTTDPALQTTSS